MMCLGVALIGAGIVAKRKARGWPRLTRQPGVGLYYVSHCGQLSFVVRPRCEVAQHSEIPLGNSCHTIYSDEMWFLIFASDSGEVTLEARFQSDAPDRTGYPNWVSTEFCVSKARYEAVCRVPYTDAAQLLAASRLSYVPEAIWAKAVEECRKLKSGN